MNSNNEIIDSKGTTQAEAEELLKNLNENEFSGSIAKLALALGRDEHEIQNILDGKSAIDEDLVMKIRGIAQERNLDIE